MTDIVIFAGPVMMRPEFSKIDWMGASVRIIPIAGAGSQNFKKLGQDLRSADGRILPNLIDKYVRGVSQIDRIVLCAYSAGHGLLNQIGLNVQDVQAVSAVVLDDAAFIWSGNPPTPGLSNWALKGALGGGLFVATSSRGKGEKYLSGTDSVSMIWNDAAQRAGQTARAVPPKAPVNVGDWQQLGVSAYWGDIPTLTHGQHHDFAPVVWQAYLAPFLGSSLQRPNLPMSGYRG